MHPFIGISLLRLCASGPAAMGRGALVQAARRRQDARTRRTLRDLPAHLRRDIGLEDLAW